MDEVVEGTVKLHMWDGSVYVIEDVRSIKVMGDSIAFKGKYYSPDRFPVGEGRYVVPKGDVALVEVNGFEPTLSPIGSLMLVVGAAVWVGFSMYCASNPKACYGSCPVYYVRSGGGWRLEAEGFSSSVIKSLARTDVDMLPYARLSDTFLLLAKNEALETQYILRTDLLLLPKGEGERVYPSPDEGRFLRVKGEVPPVAFVTPTGDELAKVRGRDGGEYRSWSDGRDLVRAETLRVRLRFAKGGRKALVLTYRQALLTTFLFYQAMAYTGRRYAEYLVKLERGKMERFLKDTLLQRFRTLYVVMDGRVVGEVKEMGPIAHNHTAIDLGHLGPGEYEVLLIGTRGFWKIDYVAGADIVGESDPIEVPPERIVGSGLISPNGFPIVLLPGDSVLFSFNLKEYGDGRYEVFLSSRGYYYEWQRREWEDEEDPAMLALLYASPRAYLRLIAPRYKRVERKMEEGFWRSKYNRREGAL